MAAKKLSLKAELKDAGVRLVGKKPAFRFMYNGQILDLRDCKIEKAVRAAKDPNCKALEYNKPSGSASGDK